MLDRKRTQKVGLPSGTVTFLFSDIEGSTERWASDRDAMREALRTHDRLVKDAIAANGGHIFKTIGDAFCAAFATPESAAAAALDVEGRLAANDFREVGGLRVRIALHSGTADQREGDYFGPALNRAARLLDVAHGGQVVVSAATAQLLRGALPAHTELLDLGQHRLKDLVEPENVWQLIAPGLRDSFPPLRSLGSLPNNLPQQVTTLIGRDDVVSEIETLVHESPLVTLVGTGGVGKTRLALQAGAEFLDDSPDGVWFVELAPLNDSALVPGAIAAVLGLMPGSTRPVLDTLLYYLKGKSLLLVLDNCEHLIEEVAEIAEAIQRRCPTVRLLTTSREPLRIDGEHVYRVPSLDYPSADVARSLDAATALSFAAVALFAERARAADRKFTLHDENAPLVANICRRLDGIALAIELAAARVNALSLNAIADSLDERFQVLTAGSRTALPRQKTLRAMIDWSHDLLGDSERTLFRRLAVFAGGFTLEFATGVGGAGAQTVDLLVSLVDKSLVQADLSRDVRYRLLESMRVYAREKLVQHDELESASRQHATAYLELAERLEDAWETTPDTAWKAQAEPELENWRAALHWAFNSDRDLGLRLAAALRSAWFTMAPSEGQRWIRAGLEAVSDSTPLPIVARLALSDAHLATYTQQYAAALPEAERALSLFAQLDDRRGIALASMFAGAARGLHGETAEGMSLLEAALSEFRRLGSPRWIGAALNYLGILHLSAGDVGSCRPFFYEALGLLRSVDAARPAAHISLYLAEAAFRDGDPVEAVQLVGEGLAAERALNDLDALVFPLCNLAAYLIALDRWDDATASAREALSLSLERQISAAVVWALHHLAAIAALRPNEDAAAAREDRRRAARLAGFVDARIIEIGTRSDFTELNEYARLKRALEDALGCEAARLIEEGKSWNEARAAEEALLI
jgi:predicted ATPase/class 3 adenylate cyclase